MSGLYRERGLESKLCALFQSKFKSDYEQTRSQYDFEVGNEDAFNSLIARRTLERAYRLNKSIFPPNPNWPALIKSGITTELFEKIGSALRSDEETIDDDFALDLADELGVLKKPQSWGSY